MWHLLFQSHLAVFSANGLRIGASRAMDQNAVGIQLLPPSFLIHPFLPHPPLHPHRSSSLLIHPSILNTVCIQLLSPSFLVHPSNLIAPHPPLQPQCSSSTPPTSALLNVLIHPSNLSPIPEQFLHSIPSRHSFPIASYVVSLNINHLPLP